MAEASRQPEGRVRQPRQPSKSERKAGLDASCRKQVGGILHDLGAELMRDRVLAGWRAHRRPIGPDRHPADHACDVRVVPRPHGVALFTRGETQALVTATLGSGFDEQTIDGMAGRYKKRFMLHYNFPPFCGRARRGRCAARAAARWATATLAERAIDAGAARARRLPVHDPHRLRDRSRATARRRWRAVCGGEPRADRRRRAARGARSPASPWVWSPTASAPSCCPTSSATRTTSATWTSRSRGRPTGITALQMDIKVKQIDWDILDHGASNQAKPKGVLHILDCMMQETTDEGARRGCSPRAELHEYAPRLEVLYGQARSHPRHHRAWRQGDPRHPGDDRAPRSTSRIRRPRARSSAPTPRRCSQRASSMVDELTQEAEIGRIYLGEGQAGRRLRRVRRDLPGHRWPDPHQPPRRRPRRTRSPTS